MGGEASGYVVWADTWSRINRVVIEPPLTEYPHYAAACEAVYSTVYSEEDYALSPQPTKSELAKARRDNGTELPFLSREAEKSDRAALMVAEVLHSRFNLDITAITADRN